MVETMVASETSVNELVERRSATLDASWRSVHGLEKVVRARAG